MLSRDINDAYQGKTSKTISRDINALEGMGLVEKRRGRGRDPESRSWPPSCRPGASSESFSSGFVTECDGDEGRGAEGERYAPSECLSLSDADYYAVRERLLHVDSHCCEYALLVDRVAQEEGHQDEDRGPVPFDLRPGSLLVVPGFVRLLRGQFSSRRLSVSAVLRGGP